MQSPAKPVRRRIILVDPQFQLAFMGRLALVLMCYMAVFFVIPLATSLMVGFMEGGFEKKEVMEMALAASGLQTTVVVSLVCTFVCLFLHGIVITFRLAGPHRRFRTVMQGLTKGQVPRGVTIRDRDYFHATAGDFDESLRSLHDRIARLKQASRVALGSMLQLGSKGHDSQEVQKALESVEKMDDLLDEFELVGANPQAVAVPPEEERGPTSVEASEKAPGEVTEELVS